jgi:hypothetical protein
VALSLGIVALGFGRLSPADLLLSGIVLASGLGLFALGYSARQRKPIDE